MVNGAGEKVAIVGSIPQTVRGLSIVLKTYAGTKVSTNGKKRIKYNRISVARVFGVNEDKIKEAVLEALKKIAPTIDMGDVIEDNE